MNAARRTVTNHRFGQAAQILVIVAACWGLNISWPRAIWIGVCFGIYVAIDRLMMWETK